MYLEVILCDMSSFDIFSFGEESCPFTHISVLSGNHLQTSLLYSWLRCRCSSFTQNRICLLLSTDSSVATVEISFSSNVNRHDQRHWRCPCSRSSQGPELVWWTDILVICKWKCDRNITPYVFISIDEYKHMFQNNEMLVMRTRSGEVL
jgi:hypothetical protein